MQRGLALFGALFLLMILNGCTRPEVTQSKLTLQIPSYQTLKGSAKGKDAKVGAMAASLLARVVVNVRGTGIQVPISMIFEANENIDGSITPVPSVINFEVPSGSARLVQVVAIYVDDNTGLGEFFYGDVSADLKGGDVNLELPIQSVGTGSINGSKVAGRFYNAEGMNPSGLLEVRYSPPGGRPPMVVLRESMIQGWFSALVLDSFPLDYVVMPQEQVVASGVTTSSFTFADAKTMKINLPPNYREYPNSNSGRSTPNPTSVIVGFFGPGVPATNKVCFAESSRTMTSLFTDTSKSTPLRWDSNNATTPDITMDRHASVAVCGTPDLTAAYTSVIPFRPQLLDQWGGGSAFAGWEGAFRFPADLSQGSSPVRAKINAGQLTSNFSILPGIPQVADAIGLFYRPSKDPRDYKTQSDAAPCRDIANGRWGFRPLGVIPLQVAQWDYNDSRMVPGDLSNSSVVAYCPLKGGQAVGGGFVTDHIDTGEMMVSAPANSFDVQTRFYQIGYGQCHPVRVRLIAESGGVTNWNVTNDQNRSFTLTATNGTQFFDLANCGGSPATTATLTIPANMTEGEVWIRHTASAYTSDTLTVATTFNGVTASRQLWLTLVNPGTPARLEWNQHDVLRMGSNECRILSIFALDSNGTPTPFGAGTTLNFGKMDVNGNPATLDSSFEVYDSCASGTAISAITVPDARFETSVAIRVTATPPSDRKIEVYASGFAWSTDTIYLNVTPLADHLAVFLNNGNPVYEGSCVPFQVRAEDAFNDLVSTATFPFNMNAYGSLMHPGEFQSPCGSMPSNGPFNLASGQYFGMGFRARSPGNGYKMETQSIFQQKMYPLNFNILPVPAANRSSNIRLHLTSDELPPNATALGSWPQPQSTTLPMPSSVSFSGSVGTGPTPKLGGALLGNINNVSVTLSNPIPDSTNFTINARVALSSLPGTTTPILSIAFAGGTPYSITLSLTSSGTLTGPGGLTSASSLAPNQTHTISLHRSGQTLSLYVNGVFSATTATGPSPVAGNNLTDVTVGPALSGLKGLIVDAGIPDASSSTFIADEHTYLVNRVP